MLVAAVSGFFFLPLPQYAYQPGAVRATESRVHLSEPADGDASEPTEGRVVEGDVASPDEDGIFFTTVSVGRAAPVDIVKSWFDDAVQILPEEDVYGTTPPEVSRAQAREQMEVSKATAAFVALSRTGHNPTFTGSGALVVQLMDGSPSEGELEAGDVIVSLEGAPMATQDDVRNALAPLGPGTSVELRVRTGKNEEDEETATVVLGEHPDDASHGILGVQLATQDRRLVADIDVELDSGKVSGPSAGLAWALALVDSLTQGDLNGGDAVAVTGEIRGDGTVGAIGGIAQKLAAVQRAGIEKFIYPAETSTDELADLRRKADGVELIPVATIDDAVAALAPDGLDGYTPGAT